MVDEKKNDDFPMENLVDINEHNTIGTEFDDIALGINDEQKITTTKEGESPERWGNRFSFVIAAIGSAIGLGNFWRFPFLVFKYGGGSFFIPYVIALIFLGIPLLMLELALGQVFQRAATKCFRDVGGGSGVFNFGGIGLAAAMVSFMIVGYYCVVMAWSLVYLVESFYTKMPWSVRDFGYEAAGNHFYDDTLHLSTGIDDTTYMVSKVFFACLVQWVCVYLCLWKGIKATGKVVYVTMIVPVVMLFVLLIRGVTLDGAKDGVNKYIGTWDMSQLNDGQMWVDAATQIVFSVSVAFGTMCAYGSYNEPNSNVVQNSIIIAVSNCMFSFITGFVVFSVVGHMKHMDPDPTHDWEYYQGKVGGPGLAFVTYPSALSLMPGVSANIFCVLFFLTFFMLGIDSAFSLVEGIVANLLEIRIFAKFGRATLLIWCCTLGFLMSCLYCSDIGYYSLDLVDFYTNNILLLLILFLEVCAVIVMHDFKGLTAKVGKKATFVYHLSVFVGWPLFLFVLLVSYEYASTSVAYGVSFGIFFTAMILGAASSCVMGAFYLVSKDEVDNIMTGVLHAAYYLTLHRAVHLTKILNKAITEDGSNGNWRMNIIWSSVVSFVVPTITSGLLALQFRQMGRNSGYGGYATGFQMIGVLIVLGAVFCFVLPMWYSNAISPDLEDEIGGKKEKKYMAESADTTEALHDN